MYLYILIRSRRVPIRCLELDFYCIALDFLLFLNFKKKILLVFELHFDF